MNKKLLIILCSALIQNFIFGAIWLPKVFSDNMVLQQKEPVAVWGEATPKSTVEVAFNGQIKSVVAGQDGKWLVKLDAMDYSKIPLEMTVNEKGGGSKVIKNILIGEVWILGGQSNMDWILTATSTRETLLTRMEMINNMKYPHLRMFKQPGEGAAEPQKDSPNRSVWEVADGKHVGSWSAIGFFFGEKLMKDLDVPVGLIKTSISGTAMHSWIPLERHKDHPHLQKELDTYNTTNAAWNYEEAYKQWEVDQKEWLLESAEAREENRPFKKPAPLKPLPVGYKGIRGPALLYNAMVSPVVPYGAKGFLWYQGEADVGRTYPNFVEIFTLLVDSWRDKWGKKDMPFLFVQLSSFGQNTTHWWPLARWQQFVTYKNVKNMGMALAVDKGEQNNIHPEAKDVVGHRLESIAMKQVYGKKEIIAYGPMYKQATFENDTATVVFDLDNDSKIVLKGEARGFEVRTGSAWSEGFATLSDNKIMVKSKDGKKVDGVRYLWKAWADADICLYNDSGLPASPFTSEYDVK